jgi:hypothetical protein
MTIFAYEFSAAQRHVLDRYTNFLGLLHPTFNSITVVFERRRASGHQLAVLASDSRFNNARFNERYLQEFWGRTREIRLLCGTYVVDLATFTRESLEITRKTSRNEPIGRVDFRSYSLSRSSTWELFAPTNVQDLIHELALRFIALRSALRQLKYTIVEVRGESFGLRSVFTRAMNHRSCQCHTQPTVVQELFREKNTAPVWDVAYSSTKASVMAREYQADIAASFNGFTAVSSQMSLFLEEMSQRTGYAINELLAAKRVSKLEELNLQLGATMERANELMAMMSHLEAWLHK